MNLNPLTHLKNIHDEVQVSGLRGAWNWSRRARHILFPTIDGTCIFESDWDVLIILDACRADLFEEIAPQFDFLDSSAIGRVGSVGSRTDSWMQNTFTPEYEDVMRRTIYVSGNPYTDSHLDHERLRDVDEVWRYAWDRDIGTVLPRPITDRAIAHYRTESPERLLLHYMQPHIPFIPANRRSSLTPDQFGAKPFDDTWVRLRDGDLARDDVWEQYRANLRYVLEDVGVLVTSIDADTVVITSDHGNAFGELGLFGHYKDVPLPVLREVPWAVTTAEATTGYEPTEYETDESESAVADRLSALGYKG